MHLKALISLPLALLASACISKVELVQKPIVFDPVIGSEVRSSSDSDMSVPFPEDESFGVWALDSQSGGRYIDDQQIHCSGGVWGSESLPFWPTSSSLTFYAYAPYHLAMRLEDGNLVLEGFDVRDDGTEVLFAKTASGLTSSEGEVELPFIHALAKLDIRVANGFGANVDVRIDRILLKGVAMRGDFHSVRHPYWRADESSTVDVTIFDSERDGQFLAGPTMQFIGDVHTIIPQGLKPSIELTYAFRVDEGEWIDAQVDTAELRDVFWEPGRYYTYSLRINEMKLSYTTGIGHWYERR
jgi:hypothetical protein